MVKWVIRLQTFDSWSCSILMILNSCGDWFDYFFLVDWIASSGDMIVSNQNVL